MPIPAACAGEKAPVRLPKDVLPVIAVWGWRENEFEQGGYQRLVDTMARHSAYNLIATTLRLPKKEVTDGDVHAQIKEAAAYARTRGMGILMDLDVRLARAAFQKAHPDELQEMLRLREVVLRDSGEAALRIASERPSDHYTSRTTPYIPLAGRLVRVYAYRRGPKGIEPHTVQDITATRCKVEAADAKEVRVAISCGPQTKGLTACVMAAFTHFAADVFAPHLLEFQRNIIESFKDADLAGVCKDEWGFPPCYDGCPAKNDFWFSRSRAEAYAQRTAGRDLVRDCLLMHVGELGRERERQAAINHFLEMSWQRNSAIEHDFYLATKASFGPSAIVATHPTWYPYPGIREFKKNGLDWWVATRDLAQTDEVTPYCVRTALAKKWGSPVWYNMYYSTNVADYEKGIWAHALGGGRIDFHPVYPLRGKHGRYARYEALLRGGLMRGDCRIRLLNFISKSPLDCPVAVVFGHACAMNWAGPAYDDVGIGVTDGLWRAGFPADLIPTSEIGGKALRVGDDGCVQYGPQRYAAVVLYHPEFERPETAAFWQKAGRGKSALYRVGDWTTTFDGEAFNGNAALPLQMAAVPDAASCVAAVVARLRELRVPPQTPATGTMTRFRRRSSSPAAKGRCRLIDGTEIVLSGARQVSGDPIQTTLEVRGRQVKVDGVGVVAVRLSQDGSLEALAAGGLRRFEVGPFRIVLDRPADVALWRDERGKLQGILQDWTGPVPPALTAITGNWLRLAVPTPLPE